MDIDNSIQPKYIILPSFWVPEDTIDLRVRRDHVPYDVWQRQGFIQSTEGNVVDYRFIESFIRNLGKSYDKAHIERCAPYVCF